RCDLRARSHVVRNNLHQRTRVQVVACARARSRRRSIQPPHRRSLPRKLHRVPRARCNLEKLGGVWGGDFSGLYDPGHFESHPEKSIEDVCPENTSCYQLKVQNKMTIYLMASGAMLLLTVGISTATVTM